MKFTDGQWLHQIGVTASYAAQTTEAVRERDELVLFVNAIAPHAPRPGSLVTDRIITDENHRFNFRLEKRSRSRARPSPGVGV